MVPFLVITAVYSNWNFKEGITQTFSYLDFSDVIKQIIVSKFLHDAKYYFLLTLTAHFTEQS
jgi:hypothetical protein